MMRGKNFRDQAALEADTNGLPHTCLADKKTLNTLIFLPLMDICRRLWMSVWSGERNSYFTL
jgi:hypothetical protein